VETAAQVIEAGADSVAVIGDIVRALDRTQRARQYLEVLGAAHRAASV
jgi:thiamine monophosphate synthase